MKKTPDQKNKVQECRQKAAEMVGKKLETEVAYKTISIDEDKKTAVFVMSTANIDRHGDIIDQESWILEHFEKNPAFFLQHRSGEFPIGKWLRVWIENDPNREGEKRLVGEAEFRVKYEDAARAFDHVVEGDMNMVSVGFIPHRVDYDEDKDAFILYDCELLECSLVGIGSNRQALLVDKDKKEDDDENDANSVRETLIDQQKVLDELVKQDDNKAVTSHLRARSLIHKAIRTLKQ